MESEEDWRAFSAQLDQALALEPEQQQQWLAALQERDPALAERVRNALAVSQRPGFAGFLAGPPLVTWHGGDTGTLVGRAVGPYVIDAEVGRGGMGSVWRAHRADGRYEGNVALKFVHAAWVGQAGEQRFRTEGTLLARLDHPHIARLLDAGMLDGTQPYLVLEYVEGAPIDAYCERHALGVEARLRLFLEVLDAVAHAHSHLIVHRDLKPSNVFVTQDGTVKLLDFGVAKLLNEDGALGAMSMAGPTALTPQFAAPEQLLGQPITTATDVYALGNLLYGLLAGIQPVTSGSKNNAELVRAIVTDVPPRASTVACLSAISRRAIAGDLDNILNKALKKAPVERYASAAAFAEDVQRYLTHQPVLARADTMSYRASKFVRRHRGGVAATILCIIAILGGLVTTIWQARRADANAIVANQQRGRALQQLRYARTIGEFLGFLLEQGSNRPFTTPELLARGEQLIQGRFTEDPALRARLLLTLGNLYAEAAQQGKAQQLFSAAQSAAYQSPDRSIQLDADCDLAHEYGDQRLFEKSLPALDAAIAAAHRSADVDPEVLAGCHVSRSEVRVDHGDFVPALADAQTALALLGTAPNSQDSAVISARIAVADTNAALGDDAAAVREYRRALAELSQMGRGRTGYASGYYGAMGRELSRAGQWLDAAAAYEQAIRIAREVAGGGDIDPAPLTNYGKLLVDLGRPREAIPLFESALQISTRLGTRKGVAMANLLSAPAWCGVGSLRECAARLHRARESLAGQLPPGNATFGTLETEAGELAWASHDARSARDHLQQALNIFGAAQGRNPNALRALALLTEVDLELGDTAGASEHAADVLAKAGQALHGFATSAWIGRAQMVQGEVYRSLGRSVEAHASLLQALDVLRDTAGIQAAWTQQTESLLKQ